MKTMRCRGEIPGQPVMLFFLKNILIFLDCYVMNEEFLWTVFELSARSGFNDDLIRPFPSDYLLKDGTKDFSRLIECIKARDSKLNNFLNSTFPAISQIIRDEKIISLFRDKKHARPDLVFKIEWPEGKEKRFHEFYSANGSAEHNSESRSSKLAFHGSKPENFYSILQHGLVNCLNKRDLFGSGTYLSTEIDVALSFAPAQVVNIKSKNGAISSLRCVCVCEVAVNSKGVKTTQKSKSVPDTYLVVTNDDSVIVRYLLLYVEEKENHSVDSFYSFIRKYGYLLTVFLFLFSMIFVALPKKSFRSTFSFG